MAKTDRKDDFQLTLSSIYLIVYNLAQAVGYVN